MIISATFTFVKSPKSSTWNDSPREPTLPWLPCIPCGPMSPCGPATPCCPCGPWIPIPVSPVSPFTPLTPCIPCGPAILVNKPWSYQFVPLNTTIWLVKSVKLPSVSIPFKLLVLVSDWTTIIKAFDSVIVVSDCISVTFIFDNSPK